MDNLKNLPSPELADLIRKFSPYLKEARKRVYFTLGVFLISTIFGFIYYDKIVRFLIRLFSLEGINIVFTSPFQFINLAISCGIATGLITVFPLLIAQIISFLKPALKIKEFRIISRLLPYSLVLFLIGFSFGVLIMKWQIDIFIESAKNLGIGNALDISNLLTTVLMTSTIMGIAFEFPILLLLLMQINLISAKQLSAKRPWIYLGAFFFAILLPVDSILADILLATPLVLLFELTLILNRILKHKKNKDS